jgi:3-oxoacyl-[acyl-carrier protein] reductase
MNLGLEGKRVLAMASSGGLGFASAEALAAEGATVALCSRDLARARDAAERIRETTGQEVFAYQADVQKKDDLEAFFESASKRFSKVPAPVSAVSTFCSATRVGRLREVSKA